MEWTKQQLDFLKDNYPTKGKQECMRLMGLKECQVRYMASQLKLRIDFNSHFIKDAQKRGADKRRGRKRPEHSKKMKEICANGGGPQKRERIDYKYKCCVCNNEVIEKIPKGGVVNKIRKTCNEKCMLELIGSKTKAKIKENGHPRGMLGKKHNEKNKLKFSQKLKARWANKNSYLNSEEYKQLVSDRNLELYKSGKLDTVNARSRGVRSWYIDGEHKYYMRSTWEVKYADLLCIFRKGGAIKDWEYETETFWFLAIKRGVRSYKPDFKVFNNDGTIEYHEVKGYMDAKSKTKLKRMAKYYPDIKMVLRDAKWFKLHLL